METRDLCFTITVASILRVFHVTDCIMLGHVEKCRIFFSFCSILDRIFIMVNGESALRNGLCRSTYQILCCVIIHGVLMNYRFNVHAKFRFLGWNLWQLLHVRLVLFCGSYSPVNIFQTFHRRSWTISLSLSLFLGRENNGAFLLEDLSLHSARIFET